MKVLWIGTKAPAPPQDGGRLLTLETIRALARAGARVTVVAPGSPPAGDATSVAALEEICQPRLLQARPRSPTAAFLDSLLRRWPYTMARHRLAPVERAVAGLVDRESFDVVHAEQLQAFPQAEPALARRLPVVLRAQNVESDLWAEAARRANPFARAWLRHQARRLGAWEGRAVTRATLTLALKEADAARLRELAGGRGEVQVLPPPFEAELPPGRGPLSGDPPLVLLGRSDWLPNRDAAEWFVGKIWPRIRERVPGARLHVFGHRRPVRGRPGVELHPAPDHSTEALVAGAVLVVPLRIASGVRMKILEAWARGLPVVATPTAAEGLGARDGAELLLADDADGFARAVERLATEPSLGGVLTAAGRRSLARAYDPDRVASELLAAYRRAAGR